MGQLQYVATVRGAINKSASACSVIHVESNYDVSGFVMLLVMFVSSR